MNWVKNTSLDLRQNIIATENKNRVIIPLAIWPLYHYNNLQVSLGLNVPWHLQGYTGLRNLYLNLQQYG